MRFDLSTHHQKYLFESGFYDQLLEEASLSDLTALGRKFLKLYFKDDNLPLPEFKIRNNVSAKWLGMTKWLRGSSNTTIEIQKSILDDEKTLARVLIHELVHHWVFMTNPAEHGHNGPWKVKAEELNKTLGAGYISQTSDESYVKNGKEYFLVIYPDRGTFIFMSTVNPSTMQKAKIARHVQDDSARIFRINDPYFAGVTSFSSTSKPEANEKLKTIYNGDKQVTIPGLEDASSAMPDLKVKVDILGDGGRVLGTVSGDYVRKKIRARSGTVDDWIEKYNEKFVTKARRA